MEKQLIVAGSSCLVDFVQNLDLEYNCSSGGLVGFPMAKRLVVRIPLNACLLFKHKALYECSLFENISVRVNQ